MSGLPPVQYKAKIVQNGIEVASCQSVNPDAVEREISHYALQYAEDGPVEIKRSTTLLEWLRATR